jgi:transglutaminase-like putative cysteine protease
MRLERGLRLLHHLTLALAGICLAYAGAPFLPELQYGILPFLALVAGAYFLKDRWILPAWSANLLGVGIACLAFWWVQTRLAEADTWMQQMSLPAAVVPYLGPVLLVLLLVKLYRPQSPGDFWLLQGLGLLQVALGSVLATGPIYGILLLAYFASGLACLAAHHRSVERRTSLLVAPLPTARWSLFGIAWALAVAGVAVPLFLITPRREGAEWDPFQRFGIKRESGPSSSTGYSDEMDLRRGGSVKVDDSPAFTVTAEDEYGRFKTDLPLDQRWRGVALDKYQDGVWTGYRVPEGTTLFRTPVREPSPGDGMFQLTYTVQPRRAGGLFLADPVPLGRLMGQLPVTMLEPRDKNHPSLFFENNGGVLPLFFTPRQEYRYRQSVSATAKRDRYPAIRVTDRYLNGLIDHQMPDLEQWTIALLRRLTADPRYGSYKVQAPRPTDDGETVAWLPPSQREAAARLLADFLANSGEYTYSLNLRREDESLDPVLDFLKNVKQGHCERYAAGLALMLRTLKVPARVIKGFRGLDHTGGGDYTVRHSHAHAWVEVYVQSRPDGSAFDWIILDPTPATDAPQTGFSLARWLQAGGRNGQDVWQRLIVNYNAGRQATLWEDLKSGRLFIRLFGWPLALWGTAALACLVWLVRRRRRKAKIAARPEGAGALMARMYRLLARYLALRRTPGQTPREFAAIASATLASRQETAAHAAFPSNLTESFYRSRFGGLMLEETESGEAASGLNALAATLRTKR